MQWILQDFEDTRKLAVALEHLEIPFTWHKVVPFVGDLVPEPAVDDPHAVILFGAYALWRYAEARGYWPGVLRIRPFVHEAAWHPHLLNGADAMFLTLREIPDRLTDDDRSWFMRPVDDAKEVPGRVRVAGEIIRLAQQVLALDENEIPGGSLHHDTVLMLTEPVRILQEWRLWIVNDRLVTASLYKEGARVVYRQGADDEVLDFARHLVALNPGYAPAYVLDICRTADGLTLLETNCLNAAGFYAADLIALASAIEALEPP
ncbi:MAG: ATP-grasp domain-containing protein [Pseudomonadota bacterium]